VVGKGYFIPIMSKCLGISDKSLYYWVSKAKAPTSQSAEQQKICQLKVEVKYLNEERNNSKVLLHILCKRRSLKYPESA